MLVIRATPANPSAAVEEMADQAILSSERYVIEREDAGRELLYGVSVFAHRDGQDLTDVLYRFPAGYVRRGRGGGDPGSRLRGLTDRDRCGPLRCAADLRRGRGRRLPPSEQDVRVAANRLLDAAAPIRPNPSYAVGRPVRLEEE